MSERTSKPPGLADSVAACCKQKDCFLDEIVRQITGSRSKKSYDKSSSEWPMP